MDTRQLCTDVARNLIRLGALSSQMLHDLHAENNAIRREWIDEFAREAVATLELTRLKIVDLTDSVPDGRMLVEITDVLLQDFQAPSLQATKPTLGAALLLFQRIVCYLKSAFAELGLVALTLGQDEQATQCGYISRQIASPARRTRPYANPRLYEKHLRRFRELDATRDPMAQLLVINSPVPDEFEGGKRLRVFPERAPATPYAGPPIALEISTPVLSTGLLDEEMPPVDRTYRVWFGTNRVPLQPTDPGQGFTGLVDTKLHLGSCLVFVPQSHEEGSLGSNWIRRTFVLRADDRLELRAIRPLERDIFQRRIAAELANAPQSRSALVFVHGFNVPFEDAALRAAQLACDLTVDGVTAFFSWPSAGGVSYYSHDEESVRVTTRHFLEFVDILLEVTGLERVDIIAHSMGNRLVAAAMSELALTAKQKRVGHLVLAAPDIGRVEFSPLAMNYTVVAAKAVTLYSSSRDKALWLSKKKHRYLRIGDEPPIYLHAGIDTISASTIKEGWLGHGYFAAAKPLISDLKKLLWAGLGPSQRGLIALPDAAMPEYWLLTAK